MSFSKEIAVKGWGACRKEGVWGEILEMESEDGDLQCVRVINGLTNRKKKILAKDVVIIPPPNVFARNKKTGEWYYIKGHKKAHSNLQRWS